MIALISMRFAPVSAVVTVAPFAPVAAEGVEDLIVGGGNT
jgi:hypothetical protein